MGCTILQLKEAILPLPAQQKGHLCSFVEIPINSHLYGFEYPPIWPYKDCISLYKRMYDSPPLKHAWNLRGFLPMHDLYV